MKHYMYLSLSVVALLLGCGGKSSNTPPPENGEASQPTPVELVEEETPAATSDTPAETSDTPAETETPEASEDAEAEQVEAESAPEEPAPSSDLQAYVGASTGYTPEYRTVMDNMDKFKQCYLDAMRVNPDLSGTLKIKFTVLKNGKVKKAKATVNELNDDVAKCVEKEMKKIKFPKRSGKRTVEYPFKFIPSPS
jgi:outer membrane biosynthesis protein TonB